MGFASEHCRVDVDGWRLVGVAGGCHLQGCRELVGCARRPFLPCLDDGAGLRARPGRVDVRRLRGGDGAELERCDDTEVAGARTPQTHPAPTGGTSRTPRGLDGARRKQCPPLRAALSTLCRARNVMVSETSSGVAHRTTACGRTSWNRALNGRCTWS